MRLFPPEADKGYFSPEANKSYLDKFRCTIYDLRLTIYD